MTIAIIENSQMGTELVQTLVKNKEHFVCGHYNSYGSAARSIKFYKPDSILLDANEVNKTEMNTIGKLKLLCPESRVIILYKGWQKDESVYDVLENGAQGYIDIDKGRIAEELKELNSEEGSAALRIAKQVLHFFQYSALSPLSEKETKVLEALALSKTRKAIAEELKLDINTIKSHINNIYSKLCVHSKAEAIELAKAKRFIIC